MRHRLHAAGSRPVGPRRAAVAHRESGRTLAGRCDVASTCWSRVRGWIGRRAAAGDALWLVPCAWVHTVGMRCTIDVVFCARDGTVVRVVTDVRPGRVVRAAGAAVTCELPAGGAAGVRPGDHLHLVHGAISGSPGWCRTDRSPEKRGGREAV
ncbi:MAG TPA: DUF192 domain-containing protein [bacterium]|nr:DUF192 domain-containing protein [bacterium]